MSTKNKKWNKKIIIEIYNKKLHITKEKKKKKYNDNKRARASYCKVKIDFPFTHHIIQIQ